MWTYDWLHLTHVLGASGKAHFLRISGDRSGVDGFSLPMELARQAPISIIRMGCIDLINMMLERHFFQ